jgi:hypothetical protein
VTHQPIKLHTRLIMISTDYYQPRSSVVTCFNKKQVGGHWSPLSESSLSKSRVVFCYTTTRQLCITPACLELRFAETPACARHVGESAPIFLACLQSKQSRVHTGLAQICRETHSLHWFTHPVVKVCISWF